MASKIINISLPEDLVKKVDVAAKAEYSSRSDYIRASLVRKLRHDELDEWGDRRADWENGVDLRNKNGDGVTIRNLTKELTKAQKKR